MSSLWRKVVFVVHPGLRDFCVAKLCRTKIQWLVSWSHSVATCCRINPRVQFGNPWVIEFFWKKWICHDLSIWIRTYLEATTKQWYLYDHGNRGYHYRKIYWNLGLQEKTVIKGCIGQWTYQSLVSTCSFDAEIKKSDHHIISPNDMFQDFVITIGFCQTKTYFETYQ